MMEWPNEERDDILMRALLAEVSVGTDNLASSVRKNRVKTARALISCGLILSPSDHLQDNQFIVSRGVYEAVMEILE
jgi:hypothetical protein